MFTIEKQNVYPFLGLDFGAVKSSIAKSWQAKKHITIDTWFIVGR